MCELTMFIHRITSLSRQATDKVSARFFMRILHPSFRRNEFKLLYFFHLCKRITEIRHLVNKATTWTKTFLKALMMHVLSCPRKNHSQWRHGGYFLDVRNYTIKNLLNVGISYFCQNMVEERQTPPLAHGN